jgi:hypothetical protein
MISPHESWIHFKNLTRMIEASKRCKTLTPVIILPSAWDDVFWNEYSKRVICLIIITVAPDWIAFAKNRSSHQPSTRVNQPYVVFWLKHISDDETMCKFQGLCGCDQKVHSLAYKYYTRFQSFSSFSRATG